MSGKREVLMGDSVPAEPSEQGASESRLERLGRLLDDLGGLIDTIGRLAEKVGRWLSGC
jgi:hypothetical protein